MKILYRLLINEVQNALSAFFEIRNKYICFVTVNCNIRGHKFIITRNTVLADRIIQIRERIPRHAENFVFGHVGRDEVTKNIKEIGSVLDKIASRIEIIISEGRFEIVERIFETISYSNNSNAIIYIDSINDKIYEMYKTF